MADFTLPHGRNPDRVRSTDSAPREAEASVRLATRLFAMIVVGSTSLRLLMRPVAVASVEVAIAVLHATDVVGECRDNERRDDCQRIDKLHASSPFSTWLTVGRA